MDFVVANGENAAGGFGITEPVLRELLEYGVDCVTTGNHFLHRREILSCLVKDMPILRPVNYPPEVPGRGAAVFPSRAGVDVGVISLQGRIFMLPVDCPFRVGLAESEKLHGRSPVVLVDFHAEATAEKVALGRHLDGRVSAVIGTHTHVQTSDDRILPEGTAYITDVGMTGPFDSVIGMETGASIQRLITQIPIRLKVGSGALRMNGALVDIDPESGRSTMIERLDLATDVC